MLDDDLGDGLCYRPAEQIFKLLSGTCMGSMLNLGGLVKLLPESLKLITGLNQFSCMSTLEPVSRLSL